MNKIIETKSKWFVGTKMCFSYLEQEKEKMKRKTTRSHLLYGRIKSFKEKKSIKFSSKSYARKKSATKSKAI